MANVFITRKSPKSKLTRIPFLPRIGLTIDFAGKQFSYLQVPILEAFLNMPKGQRTVAKLIEVSQQQIKELRLPNKEFSTSAAKKKRTSKRVQK